MVSREEYREAIGEYHAAINAFNSASPEYFDTVNARLTAAISRLNTLHKIAKREADENAE